MGLSSSYGWAALPLAFAALIGVIWLLVRWVQRREQQRTQTIARAADAEAKAREHAQVADVRGRDLGATPGVRVRDVEKRLGGEAPRPPAGGAPGA